MSLILEALKKSEAERQLGRAPGLMSPMVRVSRRRSVSPWWGVLALALVVAGGAAWWVNTQPAREASFAAKAARDASGAGPVRDPSSDAAPTRDAPTTAMQAQNADDVGATASTRLAADESRASTRTLGPPPALPANPSVPEPLGHDAVLPRDPQFDSVERESMPVATQPTPAPPASKPATTVPPIRAQTDATARDTLPASSAPATSSSATTLPQPALPTSPTTPTTTLPTPPTTALQAPPTLSAQTMSPATQTSASMPAATASAPRTTAAANAANSSTAAPLTDPLPTADTSTPPTLPPTSEPPLEPLPGVTELMPELRNALPPLKVSMHAYGHTPASRFVLIDGKRYVPGDRINASLVVEDIRRDGAVLDANGKRFLVPRP